MSRLREKFYRFMQGRCGFDSFTRFLVILSLVLSFINLFASRFSSALALVISIIDYALLIYAIFRILSRNIAKRAAENRRYLALSGKVKAWFKLQADRIRDRKAAVYRRCPNCKNVLRLPKKKGHHSVRCPCCQTRFDVNVLFL